MADDAVLERLEEAERRLMGLFDRMEQMADASTALVGKARVLVELLDDAERNHGALIGSKTLTAANELRLELSRWK